LTQEMNSKTVDSSRLKKSSRSAPVVKRANEKARLKAGSILGNITNPSSNAAKTVRVAMGKSWRTNYRKPPEKSE